MKLCSRQILCRQLIHSKPKFNTRFLFHENHSLALNSLVLTSAFLNQSIQNLSLINTFLAKNLAHYTKRRVKEFTSACRHFSINYNKLHHCRGDPANYINLKESSQNSIAKALFHLEESTLNCSDHNKTYPKLNKYTIKMSENKSGNAIIIDGKAIAE